MSTKSPDRSTQVRLRGDAARIVRERRDEIARMTGVAPSDAAVVSSLVLLGAQHAPALSR